MPFNNWIHVNSDSVVFKIYDGNNELKRRMTKYFITLHLRDYHILMLTNNNEDLVLSKNQVNVHIQAMVGAIYHFWAQEFVNFNFVA